MDQLKLVLEHKFWILAGLAILLPPIGWWAATENLASQTSTRFKKIADYEKQVPNPKDFPNRKWIEGAKQIDRELTASVVQSQEELFNHQKSQMTFPPIVQEAFGKCKVRYRADGGATPDFLEFRSFFVDFYVEDWKSAVNVVKPFKMRTGEGLVLLPDEQSGENSTLTRHMEVEQWRQSLGFTAAQMWDVQEDVWFLRALMHAIARVNTGSTEIGNSRIKQLNEVTLRGGDPVDLAARQSGKADSTSPSSAPKVRGGSMQISFGRGGGGGMESSYKGPKQFDPDDVFGDDGSKGIAAVDTRGRSRDVVVTDLKRWAQEDASKWHKRAFVLRLVMDEREIPTLLTSLTECPFPVEIRQVEHSVYTANSNKSGQFATAVVAATAANADGSETSPEQQAQQHKIAENLRMAFNMHYLAEVTVAGTLTIYAEPTTSKTASIAKAASNQTNAATRSSAGTANTKAALSSGGSAKGALARPNPVSASPAIGARGPGAQSAKAGSFASPPASANNSTSANKTNPAPSGARPAGK